MNTDMLLNDVCKDISRMIAEKHMLSRMWVVCERFLRRLWITNAKGVQKKRDPFEQVFRLHLFSKTFTNFPNSLYVSNKIKVAVRRIFFSSEKNPGFGQISSCNPEISSGFPRPTLYACRDISIGIKKPLKAFFLPWGLLLASFLDKIWTVWKATIIG